jgi:hypothetical protein
MKRLRCVLTSAAVVVGTSGWISVAYAQNCQELWVERNSYYKDGGYCFKTPRAIRYFGNAGCRYDDEGSVPLSQGTRNRIAVITRIEQSLGCN